MRVFLFKTCINMQFTHLCDKKPADSRITLSFKKQLENHPSIHISDADRYCLLCLGIAG